MPGKLCMYVVYVCTYECFVWMNNIYIHIYIYILWMNVVHTRIYVYIYYVHVFIEIHGQTHEYMGAYIHARIHTDRQRV